MSKKTRVYIVDHDMLSAINPDTGNNYRKGEILRADEIPGAEMRRYIELEAVKPKMRPEEVEVVEEPGAGDPPKE